LVSIGISLYIKLKMNHLRCSTVGINGLMLLYIYIIRHAIQLSLYACVHTECAPPFNLVQQKKHELQLMVPLAVAARVRTVQIACFYAPIGGCLFELSVNSS